VGEIARGTGKGARLLAPGEAVRGTRRARLRHYDHKRPAFASLVASSLHRWDCSYLHRFAPHCTSRGKSMTQVTVMTQFPVHAVSSVLALQPGWAMGVRGH
jgi:hypothetical protein